jgi:hypothetical protein
MFSPRAFIARWGDALAERQDFKALCALDRIEAYDSGLDCRNDHIQFGVVGIAFELLS